MKTTKLDDLNEVISKIESVTDEYQKHSDSNVQMIGYLVGSVNTALRMTYRLIKEMNEEIEDLKKKPDTYKPIFSPTPW